MKNYLSKNIYVGLSGGVDSSVAAALLKEQGHDVRGIYLKVWAPELEDFFGECPWEEDVRYGEATAKHLGIPFEVWDVSREYYEIVVDYFVREYAHGRTPNPDIMCNREIKFGIFLKRALAEGADAVATGHYARIRQKSPRNKKQETNKSQKSIFKLLKGKDPNKDQSYFLYSLTQEQLQHSLFPIGDYTKQEVRAVAREWKLPAAERKDSQGVCFLGNIPVKEFLAKRIPEHKGKLVNTRGDVVGEHDGSEFYTIGQRHGIGSPGGGAPHFVVEKNMRTNTVVVAEGADDPLLYKKEIEISNIHWISEVPSLPLACFARIRYRQPLQECVVTPTFSPLPEREGEGGVAPVRVRFHERQRAVTPGQAIVFYDGDVVLGGGVIQ